MDGLFLLVPVALALGGTFLALYLRAVADGQFEDLDDPPMRMLEDD